ncbi:hypothetical protein COY33_01910 [candidate division WWE3 bacterium CG_4_10_14_0_2_um_filter_42_7]|uniref:Dockerin domain-containing protein n=2 Tax=Katanobacteria TaxID=422282 RepID=A0A2H0X8H5_UNCKA|nr:MAG: hypothetical protein COT51_03885 [candidate division WWE3 bacterium CG08_land_8_20_14_0_20_41_15]PIZ43215.1 MAG: hypothetical protein COY33_01910 [candidate division WWE3 bacterium CG_4_10_14_0_2_um_filter_42_7]
MQRIVSLVFIVFLLTVLITPVAFAASPEVPTFQEGDINGDGLLNILDLSFIASKMGMYDSRADVNGNGILNIIDLVIAARNFERYYIPQEPTYNTVAKITFKDESEKYDVDLDRLKEALGLCGWNYEGGKVTLRIKNSGNLPEANSSCADYYDKSGDVEIKIDTRGFTIQRRAGDINLRGVDLVTWLIGHEFGAFYDWPNNFEAEREGDEGPSDEFAWRFLEVAEGVVK